MPQVTNSIQLQGPLVAVFDLVTTTRFWPQWHPATIGVGGVTERPFQQGEQIRERAQIGAHIYEGTWTVIEHQRPTHVVLESGRGLNRITYTFTQVGDQVHYRRILAYQSEHFAASAPDPERLAQLMDSQSEQALQKLKALVEQILAAEAQVAILP